MKTGNMSKGTMVGQSVLHEAIKGVLREAVREFANGAGSIPEGDADSLSQICMMGLSVSGTENPREMMRGISDKLLDHIVKGRDQVGKNPMVQKIRQFFLIEWCYRNGNLNGDWIWRWNGPREGELFYNPKVPLDQVKFPDPDTSSEEI